MRKLVDMIDRAGDLSVWVFVVGAYALVLVMTFLLTVALKVSGAVR